MKMLVMPLYAVLLRPKWDLTQIWRAPDAQVMINDQLIICLSG